MTFFLLLSFPDTTSLSTVNRQCSSSLQSIATIASAIQTGIIEIGIGAGVESMTKDYGAGAMPVSVADAVLAKQEIADCMIPMG